ENSAGVHRCARRQAYRSVVQTKKAPPFGGALEANRFQGRLAHGPELAPLGLLESGVLALGLELAQNRGVQRRGWRLAARGGPVALVRHRLDHLLAVHGLAGLAKELGRRIDRAQLLRLGLLGLSLRRHGAVLVRLLGLCLFAALALFGLRSRAGLLRTHDASP